MLKELRRTAVLAACVISASLGLPDQAAAARGATTATLDLAIVAGGGQLENGTTFSVSVVYAVGGTPSHPINVQDGSLVLDGIATDCLIASWDQGTHQATLDCEDTLYVVITGGAGVGSLNSVPVVTGRIRLVSVPPSGP